MDMLLKTSEETEESFVTAPNYDSLDCGKDGTTQLPCVINDCRSRPYKLRRHIRDQHPLIAESAVDYAICMAKKLPLI